MASTIEVKNIGPVEHVSIPVPDGGGIVVLQGKNGSGKTQTLRAVESAVTGRGKLSVRDGALRGEVEGLGVTIKVGRSTRRTGEIEVETLEGRLDVSKLVDPGIKSQDAADALRIKTLVDLAGTKADPELFYPLFGGKEQFETVVKSSSLETESPVQLAERIKRDAEEEARKHESQAEHAEVNARAKRDAARGVDLDAEADAEKLQAELELAIQQHSAIVARKEDADRMAAEVDEAKRRISELEEYRGPTSDEALAEFNKASASVDDAQDLVDRLERELEAAKQKLEIAVERRKNCDAVHSSAVHHEKVIKELRAVIESDQATAPTDAELADAAKAVDVARGKVEQGVLIRQAKQALAEADKWQNEQRDHSVEAAKLREAGKGTELVLSEIVAKTSDRLRVEAGRLVLDTSRGATYFSDLSHGERWRIALDIAIDAVGTNGLLVIDQEAWEGLDPQNRSEIAEHVRGRGVVVLTAEAADSDSIVPEVV